MIWRYILAFTLSIALGAIWGSFRRQDAPQDLPKGGKEVVQNERGQEPDDEKSDPGDIAAAKPFDPPQKQPGESAETEKTEPGTASRGIKLVWKKGLGSLDRVLKGGNEIASFTDSPVGGLGLSIAVGEGDFSEVSEGWKEIGDASTEKGPAWNHQVEVGGLEITRKVTPGGPEAGLQQLMIELVFKNTGADKVRYLLRGPSLSADGQARQVAASRVDEEVESRAVSFGQAGWRREGDADWVGLRHSGRLAVLSSAEDAVAAVVGATGAALEGLAEAGSEHKHKYYLAFGGNDPGTLESYEVEELSGINRTWEELAAGPEGRFRVVVDSARGSIPGVSLLNRWTAVEGDPERELQPLLLEQKSNPVLLSMGSWAGPDEDEEEGWSGSWKETIVAKADGVKEIIFEKDIVYEKKHTVHVRKTISLAPASEFDELLGADAGKYADGHLLRVRIELTNTSDERISSFRFRLYGPCAIPSTSARWVGRDIEFAYGTYYPNRKGVGTEIFALDGIPTLSDKKDVAWLATVNSYFTALMFPATELKSIKGIYADLIPYPSSKEEFKDVKSLRTGFRCQRKLPSKRKQTMEFGLYLGPRFSDFIKAGGRLNLEGANYLGWTSSLIKFFMWVLHLLQKVTLGNWGLAIILLTVLVKICLHPVTRKNQRGMMRMGKVMGKIKPQMDALQEKYGKDRMRYSQEVQKLWKENNVNPGKQMLGCLVIFLQMPIWIGIIWSLDYTIGLRQASFLYIDDLTRPDMLFRFPGSFAIPLVGYGEYLNLLPVLYVVLTLVNQRLQPRSKDPQAAAQQKMMGFMMVFFGFIFYGFPAGFMLYIMTSAGLGIAESKIIKAQLAREDLEAESVAAVSAPQEPLYPAKNKSAEQRVVSSSAKKKKKRRKKR